MSRGANATFMKRLLPLWVIAIVPATLAAHLFDYAVAGRNSTDGAHAWLLPALHISLALVAGLSLTLLAIALTTVRRGEALVRHSLFEVWPRLALAQTAMFAVMEHVEGNHVSLFGCLAQVVVAFITSYLLTRFARLLDECQPRAEEASRYIERIYAALPALFVRRRPHAMAYALAVRAGRARFKRPPPIG